MLLAPSQAPPPPHAADLQETRRSRPRGPCCEVEAAGAVGAQTADKHTRHVTTGNECRRLDSGTFPSQRDSHETFADPLISFGPLMRQNTNLLSLRVPTATYRPSRIDERLFSYSQLLCDCRVRFSSSSASCGAKSLSSNTFESTIPLPMFGNHHSDADVRRLRCRKCYGRVFLSSLIGLLSRGTGGSVDMTQASLRWFPASSEAGVL